MVASLSSVNSSAACLALDVLAAGAVREGQEPGGGAGA